MGEEWRGKSEGDREVERQKAPTCQSVEEIRRDAQGRFLPGQRPHPGAPGSGRPRDDFIKRMRSRSEEAEQVIIEALEAEEPEIGTPAWKHRLVAAQELLNRAWGKSVERQEISGTDGAPLSVVLNFGDLPDPEDLDDDGLSEDDPEKP